MNILVVASLKPPATAEYMVRALRDEGHDVFVCSDFEGVACDLLAKGAVDVRDICSENGLSPELILFIEGGSMRLFPVGLEKLECLTAWYGIDTHMDYAKHLHIGRLFDVTFVAQKEYVERLRADGLHQVHWLPLAFAPALHPSGNIERTYEVAYIGSDNKDIHPSRHKLLEAIRSNIPNIFIGRAQPKDMGRIYAQSKIVFNKSVNNDVNMRYFEAMGAGAVLLTDSVKDNGVEELFTEGEHFIEYQDERSLLALIWSLMQDPKRSRTIGDHARAHVLKHHTYQRRSASLVEKIRNCKKTSQKSPDAYFAAFAAMHMPAEALRAGSKCFDWSHRGSRQRVAGVVAKTGLQILGMAVSLIDRAFSKGANFVRPLS